MVVRIAALLVVLLSLFGVAKVPEEVKKTKDAVYNLWVLDENVMNIICTGIAIETDEGPAFLSAGHCVSEAPKARYYISQSVDPDMLTRVKLRWWEFEGIEYWKEGDWALFEMPEGWKGSTVPVCKGTPEPGEDVWSWTGPVGMLPILRTGVYSGEIHFPSNSEYEASLGGMHFVDIEGAPGSSGSGMLRLENGKVCVWGIWVGYFDPKPSGAIVYPLPPVIRGQ